MKTEALIRRREMAYAENTSVPIDRSKANCLRYATLGFTRVANMKHG